MRAVVEDAQSYSWITDEEPEGWRFHPIWQLHNLDRIDKHRRLALTAAALRQPASASPRASSPTRSSSTPKGA